MAAHPNNTGYELHELWDEDLIHYRAILSVLRKLGLVVNKEIVREILLEINRRAFMTIGEL